MEDLALGSGPSGQEVLRISEEEQFKGGRGPDVAGEWR